MMTVQYGGNQKQIEELSKQLNAIRGQITELKKSQEPQIVEDYEFTTSTNEKVKLSGLFGDKSELFVIHNMGRKCPYCTLWADGFNGILDHLENRASFVLSSPDSPEIQTAFAKSRGWKFKMVSTDGTTFAQDMGYRGGDWIRPGVSVFEKMADGKIKRISDSEFGPGDDYCQFWNLLDLLPQGVNGWQPKFKYKGDSNASSCCSGH